MAKKSDEAVFNIKLIRSQFPALASGAIFFDNPGGTQVPRCVLERMNDYLENCNANHGGAFQTSQASDAILQEAHRAMADFLGAGRPEEIVFGQNMTSLTFALSRSLGRWLAAGDEIVVTRLDHDANIAPWLLLAADRGAQVRWLDIHESDCTLKTEDFQALLSPRTKIVAFGYASNGVGTINDVRDLTRLAQEKGALVFIDAVQFAPHGPIDVQEIGCDFLACSAYKFFGPHLGVLYGKYDLLERLPAYKVRPAGDLPPDKFETGTLNHEGIAGTLGAIEYFQWLGQTTGWSAAGGSRRLKLSQTMTGLQTYERQLSAYLLRELQTVPGLKIRGISDPARLEQRVPTVSFTLEGWHPRRIAERLAEARIYVWDGHYYALALVERLGLKEKGGMLRVGLAHYNSRAEIDQLIRVLKSL